MDFSDLYIKLKQTHSEIVELTDQELVGFNNISTVTYKNNKTNKYLTAIMVAILFVSFLPFLLYNILPSYAKLIVDNILNIEKMLSKKDYETLTLTFFSVIIAILCYFIIIPLIHNSKITNHIKTSIKNSAFENLNIKKDNYILSTFTALYIAIGLGIIWIHFTYKNIANYTKLIFEYYIQSLLFLVFALLIFTCIVIIIKIFRSTIPNNNDTMIERRIQLNIELMEALNKINNSINIYNLSPESHQQLINNLKKINQLIKTFSRGTNKYNLEKKIEIDFLKASYAFETNIVNFIYTKDGDITSTKNSLIAYLNIFLKGDLSELPKSEIEIQKIKKAGILHFFLFGLYLTLPIIVLLTLKFFFGVNPDEYTTSLIRAMYIIWICIGIFSNPFIINEENKEIFQDIIKTLTGRA